MNSFTGLCSVAFDWFDTTDGFAKERAMVLVPVARRTEITALGFTDPAIQHLQPLKKREREEEPQYPEKAPELFRLMKEKGFLRYHEIPRGYDAALEFLVAKGFVKCTNDTSDDPLPEYDIYSFVQDELDVGVVFDETFNERLEVDERKRRALRVHWSLENSLSYLDEEFFDPNAIEEIKKLVHLAHKKALDLME